MKLSLQDVIFARSFFQMLFEKVYDKPEQAAQSEDVNFDIGGYLRSSTVVNEWENELPVLVYHGITMDCDQYLITHLQKLIKMASEKDGKSIHVECLRVGTKDQGEIYSSIFGSLRWQADSYCDLVKEHPVFGKSDFNIIALSQGGVLARDMI